MYTLAASAGAVSVLAFVQPAEAKIIYTKTHQVIGLGQSYILDINHDGLVDFTFHNRTFPIRIVSGATTYWQSASQTAEPGGYHVGYISLHGAPVASALKAGECIGGSRRFESRSGMLLEANSLGRVYGLWHNVRNRYLGLRFRIKGKNHYAWARLSVVGEYKKITATLTGYAYETIPHKPVIAGKTKGPDVITMPDTAGTLGHLALGRK